MTALIDYCGDQKTQYRVTCVFIVYKRHPALIEIVWLRPLTFNCGKNGRPKELARPEKKKEASRPSELPISSDQVIPQETSDHAPPLFNLALVLFASYLGEVDEFRFLCSKARPRSSGPGLDAWDIFTLNFPKVLLGRRSNSPLEVIIDEGRSATMGIDRLVHPLDIRVDGSQCSNMI